MTSEKFEFVLARSSVELLDEGLCWSRLGWLEGTRGRLAVLRAVLGSSQSGITRAGEALTESDLW